MVYRIYVEKKPGFDGEVRQLQNELTTLLGIRSLTGLRLLNRYDVEDISEELFRQCANTVFSEPPVDNTYDTLPAHEGAAFAVEYLPGQFDQRADSAAECIQLISQGERPLVRSARVYLLEGSLTEAELAEIKKYVINPVEAREGLPGCERNPQDDLRCAPGGGHPHRLWRAGRGRPPRLHPGKGPGHGLRRHQVLPGLLQERAPRPHHHRDQDDRHLLVGSLPPHHFGTILDDVQIDDAVVQAAFDRYMALREETGRTRKTPLPDGCGHHRRQGPETAGHPEEPGRERGDQRLHRQDQVRRGRRGSGTGCSCSRTRPTTTPPRSSPSAARPPASAAPSVTPCPAAAMSIRPCGSPAQGTPWCRSARPCPASCPSASW